MPKATEEALRKQADIMARKGTLKRKKGETLEESKNRFVYSTMNKLGLMK